MLHEPEFESNESEETPSPSKSRAGQAFRVLFYGALLAVFGLAIGVQASPQFATKVVDMTPEPVAAALASMTGSEIDAGECEFQGKSCCSSMSRASLMASTEDACEGMCPSQQAAMMAAAEAGCCSSNSEATSLVAAGDSSCSGSCPLSEAAEATLVAEVATEAEAISLDASEVAQSNADEPIAVETVVEDDSAELADEAI